MSGTNTFIDTNVLLYLLSEDQGKADRAEALLDNGAVISVQVLNEMAHVARRKLGMPWGQINELLSLIRSLCSIEPLTLEIHERGLHIAERYRLGLYDAMIVAAALFADCEILYSEDMHDSLIIDDQLRICNPFST